MLLFLDSLKPVVVLTDLNDYYMLFWITGDILFQHDASSDQLGRGKNYAWGLIHKLLASEGLVSTWGETKVVPLEDAATSLDFPIAKRQKFAIMNEQEGTNATDDVARIEDLEGDIYLFILCMYFYFIHLFFILFFYIYIILMFILFMEGDLDQTEIRRAIGSQVVHRFIEQYYPSSLRSPPPGMYI